MSSSESEVRSVNEEAVESGETSTSRSSSESRDTDEDTTQPIDVEGNSSDLEVEQEGVVEEIQDEGAIVRARLAEIDYTAATSSSSAFRTSEHISEIRSTVTDLEISGLRSRCHIPSRYVVRIPRSDERMNTPPAGSIAMPLSSMFCGFRLPIPSAVAEIILRLDLNPTQLLPNAYALLMAFCVFMKIVGHPANFDNFIELINCLPSPKSGKSSDNGFYYFTSRPKKKILVIPSSSHGKGWKSKWVIIEESRSDEFPFRRDWATGRLDLGELDPPTWADNFFKTMLRYYPMRPQELCEERVLARAGLSPARFPNLGDLVLGPTFGMSARDRAVAEMRRKEEAAAKKKAGGSRASGPQPGGSAPRTTLPRSDAPNARGPSKVTPSSPRRTAPKRPASPTREPPTKKQVTGTDKGKMKVPEGTRRREIPGPVGLPVLAREDVEPRVWELPNIDRVPGVSDDASLMADPGSTAGWELFRSTLLSKDLDEIGDWQLHDVVRVGAQMLTMHNQIFYQLGERAHRYLQRASEFKAERDALKKASTSKEEVEELKKLVSELKEGIRKKDEVIEARGKAMAEVDFNLQTAVLQKSKLEEANKKLSQDVIDAFQRGIDQGRRQMASEKEAEYHAAVPSIRLKAVEDFVSGPVFDHATLLVGVNDVDSGWNKVLGQLRSLGYVFDESQLDPSLDENRRPYPPLGEGEEICPEIEGMEFSPVIELVEEKVEKARQKEEEAKARREAAGALVGTVIDEPNQVEPPPAGLGPEELSSGVIVQALEAPSAGPSTSGPTVA